MHGGLHGKRGEGTGDGHCSEYVMHGGLEGSWGCLGGLFGGLFGGVENISLLSPFRDLYKNSMVYRQNPVLNH